MSVIIGSARIDENGNISGGSPGDQRQGSSPDYSGEVSMENFYVDNRGWIVIRFKNYSHAVAAAESMKRACNNSNIGYSQSNRYGVIKNGTNAGVKTDCDCSSLVRQCFIEATGTDPGDFSTGNEKQVLCNTGLVDAHLYKSGETLYTGDILVTASKGHTVIVVDASERAEQPYTSDYDEVAKAVVRGDYGNGSARFDALKAAGYSDSEINKIQISVNKIMSGGAKKDLDTVAREVAKGRYGNGKPRIEALKSEGYTDDEIKEIQKLVNSVYGK